MKQFICCLMLMGLAVTAMAADKPELEARLHKLAAQFQAMQSNPDKSIPADHLKNAKGIVLMDRTKAGFIFAYQGGGGVAMVRHPRTGKWSAPSFMSANEGSLGFQVGGKQSFVVILLMNTNATKSLAESSFEFGGEASGTAGDSNVKEEASFESAYPAVMVYDSVKGLYGGAAFKGGTIAPDEKANRTYYEKFVTPEEILFERKVKAGEQGEKLAARIEEWTKKK